MGSNDRSDPVQYILSMRAKASLIERTLRIYSLLGTLVAIFSGVYLVLTLIPIALTQEQKFAAALVALGLGLAVMSRTLIAIHKVREAEALERESQSEGMFDFLDTWKEFEQISKDTLRQKGERFEPHSVRSVIVRLYEEGKIDDADIKAIDEALEARNAIVHGGRHPPPSFLKAITNTLVQVIRKIAVP